MKSVIKIVERTRVWLWLLKSYLLTVLKNICPANISDLSRWLKKPSKDTSELFHWKLKTPQRKEIDFDWITRTSEAQNNIFMMEVFADCREECLAYFAVTRSRWSSDEIMILGVKACCLISAADGNSEWQRSFRRNKILLQQGIFCACVVRTRQNHNYGFWWFSFPSNVGSRMQDKLVTIPEAQTPFQNLWTRRSKIPNCTLCLDCLQSP